MTTGLLVQFRSDELEVAIKKFVSVLGIAQSDEISQENNGRTGVTFHFPTDGPIQNVRAWGAGAMACDLVCSFSVETLD